MHWQIENIEFLGLSSYQYFSLRQNPSNILLALWSAWLFSPLNLKSVWHRKFLLKTKNKIWLPLKGEWAYSSVTCGKTAFDELWIQSLALWNTTAAEQKNLQRSSSGSASVTQDGPQFKTQRLGQICRRCSLSLPESDLFLSFRCACPCPSWSFFCRLLCALFLTLCIIFFL